MPHHFYIRYNGKDKFRNRDLPITLCESSGPAGNLALWTLPYLLAKPQIATADTYWAVEAVKGRYSRQPGSRLAHLPMDVFTCVLDHLDRRTILLLGATCVGLWDPCYIYVQKSIIRSESMRGMPMPRLRDGDRLLQRSSHLEEPCRVDETREWDSRVDHHPIFRNLNIAPLSSGDWVPCASQWLDLSFPCDLHAASAIPEKPFIPKSYPGFSVPPAVVWEAGNFLEGWPHEAWLGLHWTLRNLTKKVFVRGTRLRVAFHGRGPGCDYASSNVLYASPGFGHVVLSQIATCSAQVTCARCRTLSRGQWAGDRLEVLQDAEHEAATDNSWTDDSERVIEILAEGFGLHVIPPEVVPEPVVSSPLVEELPITQQGPIIDPDYWNKTSMTTLGILACIGLLGGYLSALSSLYL